MSTGNSYWDRAEAAVRAALRRLEDLLPARARAYGAAHTLQRDLTKRRRRGPTAKRGRAAGEALGVLGLMVSAGEWAAAAAAEAGGGRTRRTRRPALARALAQNGANDLRRLAARAAARAYAN